MIITEIMLLADMFQIMDDALIKRINLLYLIIVDSTNLYDMIENQFVQFLQEFKQKFETMVQS
jgi:Zn-dependent M16 (insulinase) family peptidase